MNKVPNKVMVRSSETGLTFSYPRHLAERHDTLTILDDAEAAEVEATSRYDALDYTDLRAEVARRNADREDGDHITPTSLKAADLIAALVADDIEKE